MQIGKSMEKEMIRLENVSYAYPDGTKVLVDISFAIKKGEKVGLIGANGAGKSTLFKSLLGLVNASGTILIDGLQMNKVNLSQIRKKVGYVIQDSDNQMFMPTVMEDLIFGPMNYGMSRGEAQEKAEQIMVQLNILHLKEKYNHKISAGEKKMAAIAAILMMEPEVMLMDEPTSSLDPKNKRNLVGILNKLDVGMVIASHDMDLIRETTNRVLLLDEGRIIADGTPDEILGNMEMLIEHNL